MTRETMPSAARRPPVGRLAGLALAAALLLAACGSEGDGGATTTSGAAAPTTTSAASTTASTAATTTTASNVQEITVEVRGGQVRGERRVRVAAGTDVRLTVTSDTPDEIHVHGYDLTERVAPGQPAVIEFRADLPGAWEVELHDSHKQLLMLEVR